MGLKVWGLGFGVEVWGSGFRVQGSRLRVQGLSFRVLRLGFRVEGFGFGVEGLGFGVERNLPSPDPPALPALACNHQPSEPDQIAFRRSFICTPARRNPATSGAIHGNLKRQFAAALRAVRVCLRPLALSAGGLGLGKREEGRGKRVEKRG